MTQPGAPLSPRTQRVARALAEWPRRRVQLIEFWQLLDDADPATRADAQRRRIMSDLIEELSAGAIIELPSAASYDRTELPVLPRFVTLPRKREPVASLPPVVWHPALSWVPQARPTRSQAEALRLVNRWLHHNRDDLVVPSRERSLEIFGDEKAIDRMVGTGLFSPNRLSLEILRCRRIAPRFHYESCGPGDVLLVIENSDTFDSVHSVLRDRDDHRVGFVAWGAGTGFEASVLSVGRLPRPVAETCYFGDLDENGLRVPSNAAALAAAERLPPVRSAHGLYTALLRLGKPQSGQRKVQPDATAALVDWLDSDHREPARRFLESGERIAQETVGLTYLSRHDEWLYDLK
jgi:hypothetical protein